LGEGGFKVCLRAFGADQFDEQDPNESKAKSSYFNWLYFAISIGILTTRLVTNYVQENLSWALGYAIPCLSMMLALFLFLLGIKTYRFSTGGEGRQGKKHDNPFVRIGRVFVAAARNRRQTPSDTCLLLPNESTKKFRYYMFCLFGLLFSFVFTLCFCLQTKSFFSQVSYLNLGN